MTNILALAPLTAAPAPIVCNADWRQAFSLVNAAGAPVDLTGIAFEMQIRPAAGSGTLLASLSTGAADGSLTISAGGVLTAVLLAAVTKTMIGSAGSTVVADLLASADGATINLCPTPLSIPVNQGVTWG